MKKMILKLTIITAFTLMFTNCEKESLFLEESETTINASLDIQNSINFDYINKSLRLGKDNFQVNWNNSEIIYFRKKTDLIADEKTNKTVYEFDAYLKKEILNTSKLFTSHIIYKLIMTTDTNNYSEYKIIRFEPFKESLNILPSSNDLVNFSGMKFVLNMKGKIDDILTYKNGMEIASFKTSVIDKQIGDSDGALNKVPPVCDVLSFYYNAVECSSNGGSTSGGYVFESTINYTDWYARVPDGTFFHTDGFRYSYRSSVFDNITTRWVWVPNGGDYFQYVYTSSGSSGESANNHDFPLIPIEADRIILDIQLQLDFECQSEVILETLEQSSSIVQEVQDIFDSDDSNYNLVFTVDEFLEGTSSMGITSASSVESQWDNNKLDIEIGLNPDLLNDGTDLALATTVIHESVHAILLYKLETGGLTVENTNNNPSLSMLVDSYARFKIIEEIFGGQQPQNSESVDSYMHQYMTGIVDDIATALSEFGNNLGYDIPFSYYQILAWFGLEENLESIMYFDDDEIDEIEQLELDNIHEILLIEFNNESNAKGTKCNN